MFLYLANGCWGSSLIAYVCGIVSEYSHLVEIYDFPTDLSTMDLLAAFREYKWVWSGGVRCKQTPCSLYLLQHKCIGFIKETSIYRF